MKPSGGNAIFKFFLFFLIERKFGIMRLLHYWRPNGLSGFPEKLFGFRSSGKRLFMVD